MKSGIKESYRQAFAEYMRAKEYVVIMRELIIRFRMLNSGV